MKRLLSVLLLFICFVASAQTYDPTKATVSNKPYGMAQAFPTDARTFFYDATNFLWRPYQSTAEVKSYLNLAKYRAGNFLIIVDSGGTLNGNGTYTGGVNNFWMFKDGVLDANLVELNLQGGATGNCPTCFFTTTQLTDSSFKLNRPNGTSDTVVIDFTPGVYIATLNNGLNLVGTNGQLGGPLVKNTVINGGGFDFAISGNTFQQGQGAAITSANVMTTGHDGNSFPVIGSTQINAITTTNWQSGSIISFTFTGTPLLRNNQVAPAGSAPLLLAGGQDYTAATNDVIFFLYDAINGVWHETSRKLAGSVIPVTANNAISLSGSLLQWGGTLVKPTTVAGNLFPTFFSGGRVEMPMGLPILAAGDLVPGNDGIFFHITGTTQINAISTTNFQAGAELSFVFDNIVTVKNNTVGGLNTAPMLLAGRVDYTSAVGDYIGFKFDGVNWIETERKLSSGVTSVTASNGLTLTGTNIVLGGTLTGNTIIDGTGAFQLSITGSTNTATGLFYVNNTLGAGNNAAIRGESIGGIGIRGISTSSTGIAGSSTSGIAVNASSSSNFGLNANSTTGIAGNFLVSPATTNSIATVINIQRSSSGTAANGIGESIDMINQTATGGSSVSNQIISKWTDATLATRTSQLVLTGVTNAVTGSLADFSGATANFYGTSTGVVSTSGITGGNFVGSVSGLVAQSTVVPLWVVNTATTNNTIEEGVLIQRVASTAPSSGEGVKIQFDLRNDIPATVTTGNIIHKLTTVTSGAEVSEFDFQVNGGSGLATRFIVGGLATIANSTRFEYSKGANATSTGNLVLGTDGNVFHVTGTTTINAIATANWQAGSEIILIFDASVTVKNNTAGGAGTAVMLLAGGADFSATANDVLDLIYDGTSLFEKSRSVN